MKKNKENKKKTIVLNQNGVSSQRDILYNIGDVEYNMALHRIELTNLSPIAKLEDIKKLCQTAASYKFYSVCVNPIYVRDAFDFLKKHNNINISTLVGYPLGETFFQSKLFELKKVFEAGANMVDVYIANSAIKNQAHQVVKQQIHKLAHLADDKKNRRVRIVLDMRYLDMKELLTICGYCIDSGLHHITLTEGVNSSNLNLQLIEKLCDALGSQIKIKLNYNIRNVAELKNPAFRNVDLFATTHGVKIAEELKQLLR